MNEQALEAVVIRELVFLIHLDRFERANLDTNLAAHADRDIDVENGRVELRLANVIRFLVFALGNVNALGRALFFANLAGDAAQPLLPIVAIKHEEGKLAAVFLRSLSLLRILD